MEIQSTKIRGGKNVVMNHDHLMALQNQYSHKQHDFLYGFLHEQFLTSKSLISLPVNLPTDVTLASPLPLPERLCRLNVRFHHNVLKLHIWKFPIKGTAT